MQIMVNKMFKSISELLSEQDKKEETMAETSQDHMKLLSDEEAKNYINNDVVELLKKSLNIHWQQTTVLSAQAVHLERWGYTKLAEVIKADAKQEHEHAMINLSRLEFFDADYQPFVVSPPSWTRHDMIAIIKYNLASVQEASKAERATIMAARSVGDEITANIMIPLLQGSEDGIILYEGYLKLIEQMGLDNFLSIQA
jgi:bacterioferritin (cytochrome b1)